MALGSDNLIEDHENCHEHLVNNYSVNSFITENNEFTITRSFGDRKYSTMCFKPSSQNMVDIVITQGEYSTGKPDLFLNHIGSQDIRRKYSIKAKFGVALVIIMLMAMLALLLFCLLSTPPDQSTSTGRGHTTMIEYVNATITDTTQQDSAPDGHNIKVIYSTNSSDEKSTVVEIPG